jgi:hypothetical protein
VRTNPLRFLFLSLSAALFPFTCPAQAQPGPFDSGGVTHQLPPGKTPGTYAFSYTGTVAFSQEPAFPVTVAVTDFKHTPFLKIPVNDSNPFTISADLPPGGYWLESSVAPAKDALYWSSQLDQVFIDPSGMETIHSMSGVLLHQKKITVLSPNWKGTETLTEKRPLLVWQPLPGAAAYEVRWLEEPAPQVISTSGGGHTDATQFRMTEDTIPNRRYEWSVMALDVTGWQIGYWSAAYFYTPGGKETFAKFPDLSMRPPKGTPYLGLMPFKFSGISNMSQGIFVQSIGAGSPALQAGLQPHDLLTSFNGKPLATVSQADFVSLVRAQPVGSVVAIEFLRQGVKKSVNVTVGALP